MRAVIQRVTTAKVMVENETIGQIDRGLAILLGVQNGDTNSDSDFLAEKIAGLRIFSDSDNKMNLSLLDVGGAALIVSQFTLLGDVRKGRRPSFIAAAPPDLANLLYEAFCQQFRQRGVSVATGRFGADMQVHLINDGPVTILLDTRS